jgi:hypothetical protein
MIPHINFDFQIPKLIPELGCFPNGKKNHLNLLKKKINKKKKIKMYI